MREVVIRVHCDACKELFNETSEGSNSVTFTVGKQQWQMDLCHPCLGGSFFENARLVDDKPKKAKDFTCDGCDKSFKTQRGLYRHQSMTHEG